MTTLDGIKDFLLLFDEISLGISGGIKDDGDSARFLREASRLPIVHETSEVFEATGERQYKVNGLQGIRRH